MQNNRILDTKSLIFLIFLLFITVGIGLTSNFQLLVVAYFFLALTLFFINKEFLIILYLVVFLTNGYIPRDAYIMGVLGLEQVVNLIVLVSLLSDKRVKFKLSKIGLDSSARIALDFLLILFIYIVYVSLKMAYFDLKSTSFSSAIFSILSTSIKYLPLWLIINERIVSTKVVQKGITLGVLNLIVFAMFSGFFQGLGFYSQALEGDEISRFGGIVGNGDVNTLGSLMAMFIGFLFSKYERKEIGKGIGGIVLFVLAAVIIGLTGSRTAFLSILFISSLFVFRNLFTSKGFIIILSFTIISIIGVLFTFKSTISRIKNVDNEQLTLDLGTSNRIGKWIYYFNDFNNDKLTYLRGSDHELLFWNDQSRAAHNFFVQMIFNSGVFLLLILSYRIYLLFKFRKSFYYFPYYLFPFVFILMTVSDFGAFFLFILLLSTNKMKPPLIRASHYIKA